MDEFLNFLKKTRKKNGDNLLDSTIERYIAFITPHYNQIQALDRKNLLKYMNHHINLRGSIVLYSAFKNYLIYQGHNPKDKTSLPHLLQTPDLKKATSFNSVRVLQSKILSTGELKRFFNEITDNLMLLISSVLYDTACRRDELCNIKYSDIEFMNRLTEKGLKSIKEGIYAQINIIGKGQKARMVYLTKFSVDLFNEVYTNEKTNKTEYVFRLTKETGKQYSNPSHELYKTLLKMGNDILGRKLHPHMFRHTRLQSLADLGVPVLEIASYAGHGDIKTTMIYVHNSTLQGRRAFIHAFKQGDFRCGV